jgi:hypothetical protein
MSEMSVSAQKKEDWMNTKWRPMMGWMYMVVCIADFVLFPVLWSLVQALHGGRVETQWSPITLNGAGLFHMAMGAILGIAAYGRTQEKLNDKAGSTMPATPSFSAPTNQMPLSKTPATPFSSTGKPMPVQPEQPEL